MMNNKKYINYYLHYLLNDEANYIALAEIRNGYTLPKYGNLTFEQNSLIKYDNLCLKLIEENKELKKQLEQMQYKVGK